MIRLLMIALCFLAVAGLPAAAQSVSADRPIATASDNGYGRILFAFDAPTTVEDSVTGGVLVLRFSNPIAGSPDTIREGLPRYVALARVDGDGRTVRIALKFDFRIQTTGGGTVVAVDLVPESFAGLPQPPAVAAPPARRIAVARLPEPRPKPDLRDSTGADSAPPQIETQETETEQAPPRVDDANPVGDPVTGPARAGDGEDRATDNDPEAPRVLPGLPIRIGRHPDYSRLLFEWPDTVDYTIVHEGPQVSVTFDAEAEPALTRLNTAPPPFINGVERRLTGGKLRIDIAVEPEVTVRHFRDDSWVIVDIVNPDGIRKVSEGEDGDADPATDQAAKDETGETVGPQDPVWPPPAWSARITAPEAPAKIVRVRATDDGSLLSLDFEWNETVKAAAFRRGEHIWLVFDKGASFDLSTLSRAFRAYVEAIEQRPHEAASVLRLRVPDQMLATLASSEGTWTLMLGERVAEPPLPLTFERGAKRLGDASLAVPMPGAGKALWIKDPEVGDLFALVPAAAPVRGVITPRRFVDFVAPPTAHGLAIEPRVDDVQIKVDGEDVILFRDQGLVLTRNKVVREAKAPAGPRFSPGYMDFATWARGGEKDFNANESALQRDVAKADEKGDRLAARLEFAKFYLANDFVHEAYGMLAFIAAEEPKAESVPAFRAVRGVALVKLNRYEEALEDLASGRLANDDSAALWRAVAHAGLRDWRRTRRAFEEGRTALPLYSARTQALFRLAAAEAAVEVNDLPAADQQIAQLSADQLPEDLAAEAQILAGRIFAATGEVGDALARYQSVIDGAPEEYAVWAEYHKTKLMHDAGAISAAEAITALDRLRFRWRGDLLELNVLRALGALQIDLGRFRAGLETWRNAVSYFSQTPEARRVGDDMAKVFERLFLDGEADKLEPYEALALFYEFRELTPIGRKGDEMVRKLTDRLIALDLLEEAARLLDHQVTNRLRGAAKAQVATRLAMVYLMNREPEKALQAIRSTRQTLLPERLNRHRRLLEARALADLKRYDHALELLAEDRRPDALALRADILWHAGSWQQAGTALEEHLGEVWREARPLSDTERFDVMRAAISFSLAGDETGLGRMRRKFSGKMSESPDADAFQIVTGRIDARGIEFRALASRLASVDTLQSFMDRFRENFDADRPAMTN